MALEVRIQIQRSLKSCSLSTDYWYYTMVLKQACMWAEMLRLLLNQVIEENFGCCKFSSLHLQRSLPSLSEVQLSMHIDIAFWEADYCLKY